MFNYRLASVLFLIVYFTLRRTHKAITPPPTSSIGEFSVLLEAISIAPLPISPGPFRRSSRPTGDRQSLKAWKAALDESSTISNVDQISLIDPLTALAYASRFRPWSQRKSGRGHCGLRSRDCTKPGPRRGLPQSRCPALVQKRLRWSYF